MGVAGEVWGRLGSTTDPAQRSSPGAPRLGLNRKNGKVLDVNGASSADGAAVIQWSWTGGTNQQWKLLPNTDGAYRLSNVRSGKVLNSPGGSAEGAALDQRTDTDSDNQWWKLVPATSGYYRLVNVGSGWCADVKDGTPPPRTAPRSSSGATPEAPTRNGRSSPCSRRAARGPVPHRTGPRPSAPPRPLRRRQVSRRACNRFPQLVRRHRRDKQPGAVQRVREAPVLAAAGVEVGPYGDEHAQPGVRFTGGEQQVDEPGPLLPVPAEGEGLLESAEGLDLAVVDVDGPPLAAGLVVRCPGRAPRCGDGRGRGRCPRCRRSSSE